MKKLLAFGLTLLLATLPAAAVTVQLPFQGFLIPGHYTAGPYISGSSNTVATIGASTSKMAFFCRVYQKDLAFRQGGTKNLNHVSFSNNVRTAGTATVQVDIEGVSTSSGPPGQPDGVILGGGSASATLALNSFTNQVWFTGMPNFTASAVVSYGQLISVVWSYSAYTSGALNLLGGSTITDAASHGPNIVAATTGSNWAISFKIPNVALEFDDGTVGGCAGSMPFLAVANTDTFNSGSSPNEYGMVIQLPFASQIDQLCANYTVASATSNAVVELTDMSGNQLAVTPTIDGHTARATGGTPVMSCFPINEIALTKNTNYFVGVKPSSVNNVSIYSLSVGAATSWDAAQGGAGQNVGYATRSGGAVSAITTTKHPDFAIRVSALDDGTGNGKQSLLLNYTIP